MTVSAIVATANNNIIGKNNDIPWYLPADLKYFKKVTTGHHIIMGRNCYKSIGKPLPKRTNVIITRNPFFIVSNCLVAHSIDEALSMAYENNETEAFIIGGGQIYEQTQDLWDKVYLTKVDLEVEGDVFFPELTADKWVLRSEDFHAANEKNPHDHSFCIYERPR